MLYFSLKHKVSVIIEYTNNKKFMRPSAEKVIVYSRIQSLHVATAFFGSAQFSRIEVDRMYIIAKLCYSILQFFSFDLVLLHLHRRQYPRINPSIRQFTLKFESQCVKWFKISITWVVEVIRNWYYISHYTLSKLLNKSWINSNNVLKIEN